MALRHGFPQAVLPQFLFSQEPSLPPAVAKRPREVKFRSGKEIEAVSKEILGYTRVQLSAATGAGKSVKLPRQIAKDAGLPVLHVVPSALLAVHLYDYLVTTEHGSEFSLALDPTQPISPTGVTLTYSANVMALALIKGVSSVFSDMGGVIMVLDECHESDAYTYTLSKLAHLMGGVKTVIASSATFSPERMPMNEPQGDLESRMFSREDTPSTWDPSDEGKPWSIASLPGNVLVYLDSESESRSLMSKFNMAGATTFRITAKMPVKAFRDVMRVLNDPTSGVVVLIADYSFRSGFTFDVSTIIDSSVVQYVDVVDGAAKLRTRAAYQLERYQAQGRGARVAGSSCVYWYPKLNAESAICNLEGVEMDAAAVLFRFLGYAAPSEIKHALMAVGNVPAKFEFSANGVQPLSILSSDMLVPLVDATVGQQPSSEDFIKEVLGDYVEPQEVKDTHDYFVGVVPPVEQPPLRFADGMTFLQQLSEMSGAEASLICGRYYACAGLPNTDVFSSLYGENWRLAMREISQKPDLSAGFELTQKFELVAMFLAEYNSNLATEYGIQHMLKAHDSLHGIMARFPGQVREWSEFVGAAAREAKSVCTQLITVIDRLRCSGMVFTPVSPDIEMEKRVAKKYADRLMHAINVVQSQVDAEGYMSYIESKVADVADADEAKYEKLHIDTAVGKEVAHVKVVPCRVGTKKMQDVILDVDRSLGWNVEDYKAALASYLEDAGLSVHMIRRLSLRGTSIPPNVVLQELRDTGDFNHRSVKWFDVSILRAKDRDKVAPAARLTGPTGRKSIAY